MPWIIGIDEAGYGPNLGPFVMTAVARRVEETTVDLWDLLASWVRRAGDPADDRILVADSKLVYSPQTGLAELERGVLSFTRKSETLLAYLEAFYADTVAELSNEFWFNGATPLPHIQNESASAALVGECGEFHVRGVVVCPGRFNVLVDQHDSKGAVLSESLTALLDHFQHLGEEDEPLRFSVDKHGGRNTYFAMLQHAFPDGLVMIKEEGRDRSVYDVIGLARPLRITFQPRADVEHFCVALASMVSKYVRELCMNEFNAFWRQHLPELVPTAGYPLDSKRFLKEIEPVVKELGLAMDGLWRRR